MNGEESYDSSSLDEPGETVVLDNTGNPPPASEQSSRPSPLRSKRLRIFIILAAVLIVGGLGIGIAATKKPAKKPAPTTITINTQSLSAGTLQKLESKAGSNGTSEQLVITPDTLFKNSLEVQGSTKFDKGLSVSGTTELNGNLSVSGLITATSLSVGSLTINTLRLTGDLNFGGHIIPSGAVPTIKPDVAASGGSTTISGNDTAGTVTITVGNGVHVAGELAIITFHNPFAITPKVQLTPANTVAAATQYFVTQSPQFFSIETASVPVTGTIYTFNYLVTQ